MRPRPTPARQGGTTMIEVLVTIVILAIGLLGLAGLQVRLQLSEVEAYQRAQAMILLEDMANRVAVNRNFAADYVTGTSAPLGSNMSCPTTTDTQQQRDAGQWCRALQGAAEKSDSSNVGAMLGGRGCVQDMSNGTYLVTVAWQGLAPVSAPPAGVACGRNQYNGGTGSACTSDRCRRTVTTIVNIAPLI